MKLLWVEMEGGSRSENFHVVLYNQNDGRFHVSVFNEYLYSTKPFYKHSSLDEFMSKRKAVKLFQHYRRIAKTISRVYKYGNRHLYYFEKGYE